MTEPVWKTQVQNDLGADLGNWQALSGGDFAQSFCATVMSTRAAHDGQARVREGDRVFIKTHDNPPPNHFSTEASGLHSMAQTQTVRVPDVLGVSDDAPYLAITWIEESRQRRAHEQGDVEFGRQLARLHQFECSVYGREDKRTTGSLGLPNQPLERWADFYSTQRLLPLTRIAAERNSLSSNIISGLEVLAGKLDELVGDGVQPSRLHGDLWAGNRLLDAQGVSWLIDPASHGGHREFDLAMMRLFGGYSDHCFEAYEEMFPLDPQWEERIALHQLAPLLVHAIKFGDAYVEPTQRVLNRYL